MVHVEVLMSTYNGHKFLKEQIESILLQKDVDVHITVRDDGSNDDTVSILKEYENQNVLSWYAGNNVGPAFSFLELVKKAPESDYYALCDQDDVWLEDKLIKAVTCINRHDQSFPVLYGGRPCFVDSNLKEIKDKSLNSHIPHIVNYATGLVVRNMPGCTFVFNKSLLKEVKSTNPRYLEMHDAWITQVCLALDGVLEFDENVPILYRQHSNNVAGGTEKKIKKWKKRFGRLFGDGESVRSMTAAEVLNEIGHKIGSEKKELLLLVVNYKHSFRTRVKLAFDKRFKTDSCKTNKNFRLSVLLGVF